jgi:hypothetical protein
VAQRCGSAAPESRSEAEAVGRQLQAVVSFVALLRIVLSSLVVKTCLILEVIYGVLDFVE